MRAATAEPGLIVSDVGKQLAAWGQPMEPVESLGRATAITFSGGKATAAAETSRGGGGSAMALP